MFFSPMLANDLCVQAAADGWCLCMTVSGDASASSFLGTVAITNCNHLPHPYCAAAFANYVGGSSDRIGAPKAAPPAAV